MCLLISIPKCIELNSESKPKQIIKGTILYFEQIFDMAIRGSGLKFLNRVDIRNFIVRYPLVYQKKFRKKT
jgi:hypothetical protein